MPKAELGYVLGAFQSSREYLSSQREEELIVGRIGGDMLKCRKGDMAWILQGRWIGHIVTVKEFFGPGQVFDVMKQRMEYGKDMWIVDGVPSVTGRITAQEDRYLLPIRPDELKETEETEKEIVTAK